MTTTIESTSLPRIVRDLDEAREALTRRGGFEETDLSPRMQEGIRGVFGAHLSAEAVVARILSEVRDEGDAAVLRLDARESSLGQPPREHHQHRPDAAPEIGGLPRGRSDAQREVGGDEIVE